MWSKVAEREKIFIETMGGHLSYDGRLRKFFLLFAGRTVGVPLNEIIDLCSPFAADDFEHSLSGVAVVQFRATLSVSEYETINTLVKARPDVTVRAYGTDADLARLNFLRYFPNVNKISLDMLDISDLGPLENLSQSLESLDIGQTRRQLDLSPATFFDSLRSLRIEGHVKGLAQLIEGNRKLQSLSLWRLPIDNTLPKVNLPPLESLALTLGSMRDLTWLRQIAGLRYLALRRVKGISDLSPLVNLDSLEWLWLDALGKVTKMPDFKDNDSLHRIELTNMSGLRDDDALMGLMGAKQLRQLLVSESKLSLEAFKRISNHATLDRVGVGLGSKRLNDEVHALLNRPPIQDSAEYSVDHGILHVM